MASAAPPTLPRTPSRRQPPQAYTAAPEYERPHRAQSTTARPAAPSSPRRSASTSQAGAASSRSRNLSNNPPNVTRQDYEQTNLARPPSSRRSESQDRPSNGARADSMRQPTATPHARTHSRYTDQPTPAPATAANGAERESRSTAASSGNMRRRTTIDATTGHWDLGKTIGAGSMGKVKLARNKETGEQVAVKIVPRGTTDGEHHTQAERDRAERSKEVRTAREAAIVTLVDHPYICGMRDVVRTNYHWYMLFEYVNGGQMLDYIISHGRLKEKQARKFGRQIASALDYCHRNSIVHRDLKIENILISKNGDIKIIDFGLSNLFAPRGHLKTFCGSLYFAAPELLQAKAYLGPEVDVWSFGIVLYVLVCGKVPFDDQSMPQLHAKIKRGNVEYPPWLSPECRGLIARMLNTNPQERATMAEILTHPWMVKGFSGPPDNYLPVRRSLHLPLDEGIIEKMTGFDFGEKEVITAQLTKIMESEDYQKAVRGMERRGATQQPDAERKRGVFDFYKRRNSTTSRDTLNTPSSEAIQLGNDPINAFHPLISVYYLAMEKQEREAREKNPGALALPQSPGEKPFPIPDLPAPMAPAYTNSQAYEMPGEKPTGGRTRPRARTHGEDEAQEGRKPVDVSTAPSPTTPAIVEPEALRPSDVQQQQLPTARKESVATGLLRRLSTRRSKDPAIERTLRSERPSHPPPSLAVFGPSETPRKSFSVRRTRDRDPTPTGIRTDTATAPPAPEKGALLSPPISGGDGATDKLKSRTQGLGRSISVNSSDMRRRLTRRGVSEGSSMRPPMTSSGSQDGRKPPMDHTAAAREREAASSDVETSRPGSGGLANRTKSVGHARRGSMQTRRAVRRDLTRTSDVPEETDQDVQEDLTDGGGHTSAGSPTDFKPVFLKGVFSVSTTSSKPLTFIRTDLIRVLSQLGVEYAEIKGGFRCRHAPSIRATATGEDPAAMQFHPPQSGDSASGGGHRRKISFGGFTRNADRDAFRSTGAQQSQPQASTPSRKPPRDASYDNTETESDDDATPTAATRHPSNATRVAGETSTHVQSDLGASMVLKFEIFVVKVPLINLHGIQFKKIDGGTWQYKNMAQTILNELRL
ncbi:Serine/threonine-protein kinase [Teratosphaeriaceae sp. CCFEE 6253]|nr:Serine/threonine-protein kinase [Teratosphaeriaceae sp. CCFEE 6253]